MRHRGLPTVMLVAAIALVYHGVVAHDFVDFDDFIHIVHNPNLEAGLGFDAVVRAFSTSYGITANWIPLSALSLQVDYSLFGGSAAAFHVTNVILHTGSTLMLFFALTSMTGSPWRSAFVAAVFALHPLQVESVAWASERKGLLSGFFFAATLLCYAGYTKRPHWNVRYLGVLLCLTAALLSKPMAVTLPFVLLLLDYWPLRRLGNGDGQPRPSSAALSRALFEKLPMLVIAAAASAITLEVQRSAGATGFGDRLGVGARIANALESVAAYLGDVFWPRDLAVFYPHPHVDGVDNPALAIGAGLLLATVTAAIAFGARNRGYLWVGWFWFLGMLVPVLGFVAVGFAARADRYMYLPIIGVAIALSWGATELLGRGRRSQMALGMAALALCIAMAGASWLQLQHWSDTIPLFEHAARVTQGNFIAHHRLAVAKLFGGRAEEADAHYTASIASGPPRADVHAGYADLLADGGRLEDAIGHYQRALELAPDKGQTHMKIGFALLIAERPAEARPHLEQAATQLGSTPDLHVGLAMACVGTGDLAGAISNYRAALLLNPNLLTAADKLAWILATGEELRLTDPVEAIRLAEAVTQERRSARTLDTLAAAYAANSRFEDAVETATEALELARSNGNTVLIRPITERISFYANERAFIDWNSRAIH